MNHYIVWVASIMKCLCKLHTIESNLTTVMTRNPQGPLSGVDKPAACCSMPSLKPISQFESKDK